MRPVRWSARLDSGKLREQGRTRHRAGVPGEGAPMLILVVEDEALVGLVLVLVRGGHDVLGPAGTAAEALALAERTPPELALVDINLRNGGDGVGVARTLLGRHGC